MAKQSKSVSFKSATISVHDMTITEYLKDDTIEHSLISVLKAWDGVDGVSLSIKQDSDTEFNDTDESGDETD